MFKIFPGTFTLDNRKVPIKEVKWREEATSDETIINLWSQAHAHKIKFWGVPTGLMNNILVLDVDVKDGGHHTIKNYHVPMTLTQKTKSGGTHYIFKYPNDGKVYGNRVKFDEGLDIRGEGGYIAWYGADNTPIAEAPEWLLEQALNEAKEIDLDKVVKVSEEIAQATLNEACDNIRNAPQGESNNILNIESYRIGQLIASNSLNKELARDRLFKAAIERGKPEYEATATINSGFKGGGENPITSPFDNVEPVLIIPELDSKVIDRWTPRFFSRHELTDITKLRRPQLFKNWSTRDIQLTTADGGTGKTTLKLNEAIALALGESFLGFECTGEGRTLFITGEDTKEKLGAMIGMILKQMGLLDGSPENNIKVRKVLDSILVKKDADLCLITKSRENFITVNQDALKKLNEAIEDLRPAMIVFDPISSFWGSESALNDMSKAVAKFMGVLVDKGNACVDIINHMGKQSSSNKDMTQFAGRGGTGLPSHARVSRVLRPLYDDEYRDMTGRELEDNQSAMLCNVNKFSDGSPLYNKPFVILREGYLFSKIDIIEEKVKEERNKMSDTERIFTFIQDERSEKRYPIKPIVLSHFMSMSDKISKVRVENALQVLQYTGHMGQRLKLIENPDPEMRERAFIITDMNGKES